jgi:DNA repair exonuclease SbcCD ATPase subunit
MTELSLSGSFLLQPVIAPSDPEKQCKEVSVGFEEGTASSGTKNPDFITFPCKTVADPLPEKAIESIDFHRVQFQLKTARLDLERTRLESALERKKLSAENERLARELSLVTAERDRLFASERGLRDELDGARASHGAEVSALKRTEDTLRHDLAELRDVLVAEQEMCRKLEAKVAVLRAADSEHNKKDSTLNEEMTFLRAEHLSSIRQLGELNSKLTELERSNANLSAQLSAQEDFICIRDQLAADAIDYRELSAANCRLREEASQISGHLANNRLLQERLYAAERRLARLEGVESEYLQLLRNGTESSEAKASKKTKQSEESSEARKELLAAQEAECSLKSQLSRAGSELDSVRSQLAELQGSLQRTVLEAKEAKALLSVKDDHISRLKQQIESLKLIK